MNIKLTHELEPGDVARLAEGAGRTWRIIQKVLPGHVTIAVEYLRCIPQGIDWRVLPNVEHGSYDKGDRWLLAVDGNWTIPPTCYPQHPRP